jgi:tetratricopeptide (TPR) repeat protein
MARFRKAAFGSVVALLAAIYSQAGAISFAAGTGEPNDPYQIATAEQLISIGSDPNFVRQDNIDHILVAFQRTDIGWQYEVRGRLFTKWLLRGMAMSSQKSQHNDDSPNGELLTFLKDGGQISIPMTFNTGKQEVEAFGEGHIVPGENLKAAFRLLILQLSSARTSFPDRVRRGSDRSPRATAVIPEAEYLHGWGRAEMAAEAFMEVLSSSEDKYDLATRVKMEARFGDQKMDQATREQEAKGQILGWYVMLAQDLTAIKRHDDAIKWLGSIRSQFANDNTQKQGLPFNVVVDLSVTKAMADVYEAKEEYDQAISHLLAADNNIKSFIPGMKPEDKAGWEAFQTDLLKKQAQLKDKIAKASAEKNAPVKEAGKN